MIKGYGKIMCFNDENGVKHIFDESDIFSLCRKEKAILKRDYYGRKTYVLRRNLESITCKKCKKIYQKQLLDKNIPITFGFPYSLVIHNKEEANDVLLYLCRDCPIHECSGNQAKKCNEIKQEIIDIFQEEKKDDKI